MKTRLVLALRLLLLCAAAPAWAQTAAPAAAASAAAARPGVTVTDQRGEAAEPNVRHSVIEDDGAKIDELRVRGQMQHIIVTPKVGTTKSYEILIAPGGRDLTEGTGGARSAAGKRVWSVLNF